MSVDHTHGLYGYIHHKCRCETCTEAIRASRRRHYEKHREQRLRYIAEWRNKNPEYQKKWESKNRERRTQYQRDRVKKLGDSERKRRAEYRQRKREDIAKYNKEYRIANIDRINERSSKNRERNRDERLANLKRYLSNRYKNDPMFRLANSLRVRINRALSLRTAKKRARSMELIGCSVEHLRRHLESKFENGMTWTNRSAWHIDHIQPCSSFDLSTEEGQRACFHWSNLQPLWKSENLSKGSKMDWKKKRTVMQEIARGEAA